MSSRAGPVGDPSALRAFRMTLSDALATILIVDTYRVYILARKRRVLYVRITNDLERRLADYRSGLTKGFVTRYNVDRLVHIEEFTDPLTAIEREKRIKRWVRRRKVALIEETNPEWKDLSDSRSGTS